MYTILVNQDNTMSTSVRERIMQRSKLVDSLHFLVDHIYKELDMSDFTVTMEYILPISKKYVTEILVKSNELKFIGGISDKDIVGDEKGLSKNFPQGNRVYDANAIAMACLAQPVGNTGGYSYLYAVNDENFQKPPTD